MNCWGRYWCNVCHKRSLRRKNTPCDCQRNPEQRPQGWAKLVSWSLSAVEFPKHLRELSFWKYGRSNVFAQVEGP